MDFKSTGSFSAYTLCPPPMWMALRGPWGGVRTSIFLKGTLRSEAWKCPLNFLGLPHVKLNRDLFKFFTPSTFFDTKVHKPYYYYVILYFLLLILKSHTHTHTHTHTHSRVTKQQFYWTYFIDYELHEERYCVCHIHSHSPSIVPGP